MSTTTAERAPPRRQTDPAVHRITPQTEPVHVRQADGSVSDVLMVDAAVWERGVVRVTGWCVGGSALSLMRNGVLVEGHLTRNPRPDVASDLSLVEPFEGFGFTLTAHAPFGEFALEWLAKHPASPGSVFKGTLDVAAPDRPGPSRPGALGHIEAAMFFPDAQAIALCGWALSPIPGVVWLETDEGERGELNNAYRIYRQDVFDAFGRGMAEGTPEPGFIVAMHVEGCPSRIRLVTQDEHAKSPRVIQEIECPQTRGSATDAYKWLSGMHTPVTALHARIPKVDTRIIGPLIERDRASWKFLPVLRRDVGPPVQRPKVSVVIPLYGRADFVEHQLVEFAKDDWLQRYAQLIYVIDDPRLLDSFPPLAQALYRLYQVPFTWLWGSTNRGFSGANNLGADHADAPHLVFLNSDAFPCRPGWLQPLLSTLEADHTVGAVGPRLLFGDGSIQHASMRFERRDELGIWINHHPYSGLAPHLDPFTKLSAVPSITGACLAIRKKVLTEIGGWDTGYLVGDFEDSDLCLNLRSHGYTVAYDPTLQLTHLERQSFKLLGQDEFRTKVVIYNAVRHQGRWGSLLAAEQKNLKAKNKP